MAPSKADAAVALDLGLEHSDGAQSREPVSGKPAELVADRVAADLGSDHSRSTTTLFAGVKMRARSDLATMASACHCCQRICAYSPSVICILAIP